MIKSTFYNLPDDKRKRIIDAIFSEFSNSSADKVSINRIIKAANISRGSFYQYFDDKVDLVEVLTRTFLDVSLKKIKLVIQETSGDIFYIYSRLYEFVSALNNNEKQKLIMKNLMRNIKANDGLISDYIKNRYKGMFQIEDFLGQCRRDNLKFKSDDDIRCLNQILTQVLKNALFNVFVIGVPCDKVSEDYQRKLEIIKTGALI